MAPLTSQTQHEADFLDTYSKGRMAHAWLLTGPRGIGKAQFARRAATWLIAHGRDSFATPPSLDIELTHPAQRLIDSGAHPEFLWLTRDIAASKARKLSDSDAAEEDLARNITVDQVRNLIGRMRNKPAVADHRAVVIDSIDDLERGAANALLKTLEEPPANTMFFLISHNPGRLLPTIRSRCRSMRFAPLTDDAMIRAVKGIMPDLDDDTVHMLVRLGAGSPGKALAYAGLSGIAEIEKQLRAIVGTGDHDNRLRTDLARQFGLAAARSKFDTMLAQAVAITSEYAHSGGEGGMAAQAVRDQLLSVGSAAVRNSEDLATVTFAIGNSLATLATGTTARSTASQ